jgi:hypothetical protein
MHAHARVPDRPDRERRRRPEWRRNHRRKLVVSDNLQFELLACGMFFFGYECETILSVKEYSFYILNDFWHFLYSLSYIVYFIL